MTRFYDPKLQGPGHSAFFRGPSCRGVPGVLRSGCARRLTYLDSAESLKDLAGLPGNRLEALRGDRAGQRSIRINAQWRICFRWEDDGPCNVEIVEYH